MKKINDLDNSKLTLIAVKDKIKKSNNSPEIDIKEIKNKIYYGREEKEDLYSFTLKPGIYTFFVKRKEKAYLNKFDGLGFFKSNLIDENNNLIEIIYDKYALY